MAAVADQQQQQQQPDFHALSGHFRGMSIEVDGCSNLVAVREANVLEAIAQLSTNVNTSIAAVHTGIGTINTSLAALHTDVNRINTSLAALRTDMNTITTSVGDLRTEMREKMQDMRASMEDFDYNARARTLNIMTHRSETFLHRLKNTTTHELVNVPQTLGEIKALRVGEVNQYLEALGQTPTGSAEEKKTQLLQFLGVSSY